MPPAGQLLALCLDRKTGKTYGNAMPGAATGPTATAPITVRHGTYASPSPVTDETVVFFYGNGDLVGFNMKGDKLWARNIKRTTVTSPSSGPFRHAYTL